MNSGREERTENVREVVALLMGASKALLDAAELLLRMAEAPPAHPEEPGPPAEGAVADVGLTPRELQVVELLGRGCTNRQIGRTLGISDHTVRSHLQAAYRKLGAGHRSEAILFAQRAGLIRTLPR